MDVECHPHTAAVIHQYPDGRGAARWMLNFGLMEVHYDSDANALSAMVLLVSELEHPAVSYVEWLVVPLIEAV
ncbi:hypothetical protein Nepgr_020363 [Nepenthes gracilis]|uniref:Uncharacterized protein n=1 Tax=Nepenthes gracilis TaxID=150966 RepID=A0AAD3XV05_NEPGR|nr:hypothetical protein Nepgr_020363 [Nepenthes gracilis]